MDINWSSVFLPSTPLLEIIIRGTLVYIALFILLRVILKRQSGGVSISDLLVIVLIADAAQNAMANDYKSVTDGVLLVAVIIFWSFALDWLGYHFKFIERFVHPSALPLIKNGKLQLNNMRQELITREELLSQLRLQGINRIEDVKEAYMEGDGQISIVSREEDQKNGAARKKGIS